MAEFVEVAALDQIKPGASLVVQLGRETVALFNVDGQIFAITDSCPHAGASLAAGAMDGKVVTCRAHRLKIDVTTGYVGGDPGFATVPPRTAKVSASATSSHRNLPFDDQRPIRLPCVSWYALAASMRVGGAYEPR